MFAKMLGHSPNFESMLRSAKMVAETDATALIIGETGTGKEVLAQAMHQSSPRAQKPLVSINCAALPESLAESELFGHRKGSFTGAINNQPGRLQSADNGTLFLDEIDSLSLPIQAKFLRFLETGEIQPVGETNNLRLNVRVIAATNASLADKIATGTFRNDLYYRLNVVPISIPALRERMGDVPLLTQHFSQHYAQEHGMEPVSFNRCAQQRMNSYCWPGNVRELRNVCERLSILLAGKIIDVTNLPTELQQHQDAADIQQFKIMLPDEGLQLEELERTFILQALERTNGNRARSARLLGISRDTLIYRMQKHAIT